jgi:putative OPT family oligopeptide transporter
VLIFLGGVISWGIAIPIYSNWLSPSDVALWAEYQSGANAIDLAFSIWTSKIRYLGVGAMLVGGIWALVSMRGSLFAGVRSGLQQHVRSGASVPHTEADTPMKLVLLGIAVFVIPIFVLYQSIVASISVGLVMTLVMVVTGFLFSSVAAYMAGLVGSSNNPISGVTIATILFASLLLLWITGDAAIGPAAAIMIGGVVASAAAIAGDNMQDLKAGFILGATSWKQQLMQGVSVISSVLVMAPILNLLLIAYGIGVPTAEHPNPLAAPQATLMQSVADGVFKGGLPWDMVAIGAAVGISIIIIDEVLKARGASFRAPVLAVAVGIYLPLELSVPICIGGLIAYCADRVKARRGVTDELRPGMLFAAGLITGEALLGILIAIPIAGGYADLFAVPDAFHVSGIVGLMVVAAVAYGLFRVAVSQASDD